MAMVPSVYKRLKTALRSGSIAGRQSVGISTGVLILVLLLLQVVPVLAQETAKGAEAYRGFPLRRAKVIRWGAAERYGRREPTTGGGEPPRNKRRRNGATIE